MTNSPAVDRARHVWALPRTDLDADVLSDFADYQRSINLSSSTIENRASILRSLQRFLGMSLLEATHRDLRAFVARPVATGGHRAAGSMRTERGVLQAFYRFLVEDGHLDADPSVKLAPITAPKGEPRPFTLEQIDAMLSSGAYRKTRAMILLGYYQGFRVSMIAAVHGADIDMAAQTIRTVGKGGKERTLPLHPIIAELALSMPRDDWWFPARRGRGGHIHGASVTERITAAKLRAGITDPTLTPHSLRHAFGTDLVEAGVDIRVVQELMMHASLATTQIYTGVSARLKREGLHALPARGIPERSGRVAPINAPRTEYPAAA